MHAKTGMCLECLTDYETQLRLKGVYKEYEQNKLLQNQLSYLKDIKQKLEEAKEYAAKNTFTFVNSNGLVEEWDNVARGQLLKNLEVDYKACLKAVKDTEKEIKKLTKIVASADAKK